MSGSIFISYRRDDTAGYARAVADELGRHLGAERVFIDVDDINAGQPFSEVIARAMGESEVLLVLIGKRWRGEREGGGPARIAEAGDLVRQEVAAGLARRMRVIPLLFDGATMPTEAQLPDELRPLAGRNALDIGGTRFAADIERLVTALHDALGDAPAPVASARPRRVAWGWMVGSALVAAAALAGVFWQQRAPSPQAERAAARPPINGTWQAEVNYDWPNARYMERFDFRGEAGELHGSASFLGVPRGVLEGAVGLDGLRFVTRTGELGAGGASAESVHRYRGRWVGGEIRFVMQTEGGASAHLPVEFVARPASQAGR